MTNNFSKITQWYRLRRCCDFVKSHDQQQAWDLLQHRIAQRQKHRLWRRCLGTAAAIALLGGVAWWWAAPDLHPTAQDSTLPTMAQAKSRPSVGITHQGHAYRISVPTGADYTKQLADGTRITINGNTTLDYPKTFDAHQREVKLAGEAYFEVAHQDNCPFIVRTQTGDIEVLGTHFNVQASAHQTIVTLEEGSVRLQLGLHQAVLVPGQQARMSTDGHIEVSTVNTHNYTSWATGTYEFTDTPLSEIARQMGLWYGVEMHIDNPDVAATRFTGMMQRSESLQSVLNMLETISDLHFDMDGHQITVTATTPTTSHSNQ